MYWWYWKNANLYYDNILKQNSVIVFKFKYIAINWESGTRFGYTTLHNLFKMKYLRLKQIINIFASQCTILISNYWNSYYQKLLFVFFLGLSWK